MKLKRRNQKVKGAKNWLFEKINRSDKFLTRLIKKEREDKNPNTRNENLTFTTYPVDHKRTIKEYCKQHCVHKFDYVDEVDPGLETHNLSTVTPEEVDNLSKAMSFQKKMNQ